jgi:hypothetical protein
MQKNFLAALSNDPDSIARALEIVGAKIRNSPVDDGETDDAINTLQLAFSDDDNNELNDLERNRLASFEQWSDNNILPKMLDAVNAAIFDFPTATTALNAYDIKWFSEQPLSNTGKQQIAGAVLRLVLQYSTSINTFWQALTDDDTDILAEVSFNIVSEKNKDFTQ